MCKVRIQQPRRIYPAPDWAIAAAQRHVRIALDVSRGVVAGACSPTSVGWQSAHNMAEWWD